MAPPPSCYWQTLWLEIACNCSRRRPSILVGSLSTLSSKLPGICSSRIDRSEIWVRRTSEGQLNASGIGLSRPEDDAHTHGAVDSQSAHRHEVAAAVIVFEIATKPVGLEIIAPDPRRLRIAALVG